MGSFRPAAASCGVKGPHIRGVQGGLRTKEMFGLLHSYPLRVMDEL